MKELIKYSINKFDLNLSKKIVLTEAASGNYMCTPLIAAMAGANVYAIGRDSKYGAFKEVVSEITNFAKSLGVYQNINFVQSLDEVKMDSLDIVTNTGFVRPIDNDFIIKLNKNCVITLVYEPWEIRDEDVDIKSCISNGIKVFGTDESDSLLQTMRYLGYIVLHFLLVEKKTPFRTKILLIGSEKFNISIHNVLNSLKFECESVLTQDAEIIHDITEYDVIVCTEMVLDTLIIGSKNAMIDSSNLKENQLIIHIAGNVDVQNMSAKIYPENPAPARYMSYKTDFIDPLAVVDLHCAALKVGEGMLIASKLNLDLKDFNKFMSDNYPALPIVY